MSRLENIKNWGQSIWLDNLSRTLLREGTLSRLIEQDGISGVTSNPAIFRKALSESSYYREDMARLKNELANAEARYEALAVPDIQEACDLLFPVWRAAHGNDGYVSLEVSPALAHDVDGTVTAAHRLRARVNRPNLMIKVPATPAGIIAFEKLISDGVSVNVTLLFSLHQTSEVFSAYIRGLQKHLAGGGSAEHLKAVASLFLSRIDSHVDPLLAAQSANPQAARLQGRVALAVAKQTYRLYKQVFHGEAFHNLANAGCRPQYLLWASTGTKNPAYPDVKYIDDLIGPETINTVPDATLDAFRDHGHVASTVEHGMDEAESVLMRLRQIGIDPDQVGETLQVEGLKLFAEAYEHMLASC